MNGMRRQEADERGGAADEPARMRAYHRVLKLSRTIADLAGEAMTLPAHLVEALQYRSREIGLPMSIRNTHERQLEMPMD